MQAGVCEGLGLAVREWAKAVQRAGTGRFLNGERPDKAFRILLFLFLKEKQAFERKKKITVLF